MRDGAGSESARAPVVHGDRAAAERRRRDQLEPSRAGQPALVQGRAVAGDPGVDEELVLVDQIQPVQLGRELAATEERSINATGVKSDESVTDNDGCQVA
jgi:hypothetical protein